MYHSPRRGGGGSYARGTPLGLLGRDLYNHQHGRHVCTPMYIYKGTMYMYLAHKKPHQPRTLQQAYA